MTEDWVSNNAKSMRSGIICPFCLSVLTKLTFCDCRCEQTIFGCHRQQTLFDYRSQQALSDLKRELTLECMAEGALRNCRQQEVSHSLLRHRMLHLLTPRPALCLQGPQRYQPACIAKWCAVTLFGIVHDLNAAADCMHTMFSTRTAKTSMYAYSQSWHAQPPCCHTLV